MAFDPSELRDKSGKWTAGAGGHGPSEKARDAINWIKSPEAKNLISKLSAPEHIKSATTMALQSALFQLGVNDPHVDQIVKHQVNTFATNAKVTKAHAHQLMLTAVRLLKRGRG